ncbi:MAG: hypothetical protein HZA51_11620 [Planctomycetes bacterium]|nr:hypothetical protein [Planctomycetota bacterium]
MTSGTCTINGAATGPSVSILGAGVACTVTDTVTCANCLTDTSLVGTLNIGVVSALMPSCEITAAQPCANSTGNSACVADGGVTASYTWSITGGTITSGQGTRCITYSANDNGFVNLGVIIITTSLPGIPGCECTGAKVLTIVPGPICTITAGPSPCPGSTGNIASVADAGVGATYVWSITNGTITAGQGTTTVTYTTGATGTVVLNVDVTNGGCTCHGTLQIPLADALNCTITALAPCPNSTGNTACVPVHNEGNVTTYLWSITGGTITGGLGTHCITYTAGASGTVVLTINVSEIDCDCPCNGTLTLDIKPNPDCTITAGVPCPSSIGNTASVPDAGIGATYLWSITGGVITAGQGTNSLTYTANASGTVVLSIDVNKNGCTCHGSKELIISSVLDCTITAAAPCPNTTGNTASVPNAGVGATYVWVLTGGTITAGQGTQTITYTANATGPVVLTVDVNRSGCSCHGTLTLNIKPAPICTITAATPCPDSTGNTASVADAGVGATYVWTITGGTLTAGQGTSSITYTANASGTVVFTVVVTAANGCFCEGTLSVTIRATLDCTITAVAPCPNSTGNTASVPDAGVGATYAWTITGGTITAGQGTNTIAYTANASGAVVLTVEVTRNGCSCRGTLTLQIFAALDCTITAAAPCPNSIGNTASVPDAGVGATYAWVLTGGTITAGQGTRTITYTANASGAVVLTVDVTKNGCSCHGTLTLNIKSAPNCTITATTPCPGSSGNTASVADAGVGATYVWTITGGAITAGQGTPTITYTSNGSGVLSFGIVVTNGAGCICEGSRTLTIAPSLICAIAAPTVGGTFTGTITGGTGPYTCLASFNVSGWVVDSCVVNNAGNGPGFTVTYHRTDGTCSPVEAPTVSVFITDSIGCQSLCTQTVPCPPSGCIITGPSLICVGGSAELCVSPATGTIGPVTISWTGPNGFAATTSCITASTPGVYSATITDGNGLTSVCCAPLGVLKLKGIASPCAGRSNLPYTVHVDFSGAGGFAGTFNWTITGNGTFCDGSTTATGDPVCVHAGAPGSFTLTATVNGLVTYTCDGTETIGPVAGTCSLIVPVISCP